MSLRNKRIIVTGAASGIGQQTAKLLKQKRAKVIAFDMNEPSKYVDEYIPINLADPKSIQQAVSQFEGGADALCNVAGVPPTVPLPLIMQVNTMGTIAFTEAIVSKLNDGASIVNVASVAGMGWSQNLADVKEFLALKDFSKAGAFLEKKGYDDATTYNLSKQVIIVWTMINYYTWKEQGIRMNAVSPGPIQTPILKDFMATIAKRGKKKQLIDRPGKPEEIAGVIAFLCDNAQSQWINAQNIIADGGLFSGRFKMQNGF